MPKLLTLEDIMNQPEEGTDSSGPKLLSLKDIMSYEEPPSAGYGEIISKGLKSFGPSQRATGGQLLEALGEQPGSAIQEYISSVPSEEDSIIDMYLKGLREQGSKVKALGTALPAYIGEKLTGGLQEYGQRIREKANKELGQPELRPYVNSEDMTKRIVDAAVRSASKMAPGLVASAITKNPAFAITQGVVDTGADSYSEARQHGYTPNQALMYGASQGYIEGLFGQLPIEILLKPGSTLIKRILSTVAAESGTEAATQLAQDIVKSHTINPDLSVDEMIENATIAAGAGGLTGGGVAVPAHGIGAINERIGQNAELEQALPELESIAQQQAREAMNPNATGAPLTMADLAETIEANSIDEQLDEQLDGQDAYESQFLEEIIPEEELAAEEIAEEPIETIKRQWNRNLEEEPITEENVLERIVDSARNAYPQQEINEENVLGKIVEAAREEYPKEITEENVLEHIAEGLKKNYSEVTPENVLGRIVQSARNQYPGEENILQQEVDVLNGARKRKWKLTPIESQLRDAIVTAENPLSEPVISKKEITEENVPEKYTVEQAELMGRLFDVAKKINPHVKVEFVESLMHPKKPLKVLNGLYNPETNSIKLNLSQEEHEVARSAFHELYHSVHNLLTPVENKVMNQWLGASVKSPKVIAAYKAKGYAKKYVREELFADSFAGFMMPGNKFNKLNELVPPKIKEIFSRVKKFIDNSLSTIRKYNPQTTQDVFQHILSGEVAKRYKPEQISDAILKAPPEIRYSMNADNVPKIVRALKSPALESIMKTPVDPGSQAGFNRINASYSQNPHELLSSLREQAQTNSGDPKDIQKLAIDFLARETSPEALKEYKTDWERFKDDMTSVDTKDFKWKLVGAIAKGTFTNDALLRIPARFFKSKTMTKIADWFYYKPGSGEYGNQTMNDGKKEFGDRIEALAKQYGKKFTKNQRTAITKVLQGYLKVKPGTKESDLLLEGATLYRGISDQIRDYMLDNGVDMGVVDNYVRRAINQESVLKSAASREKFVELATKAYELSLNKYNLKSYSPRKLAQDLLDKLDIQSEGYIEDLDSLNILNNNNKSFREDEDIHGPGELSITIARAWPKEAEEILRPFLYQDIADLIALSAKQASSKVEFDIRFGGDKYGLLYDKILDTGLEKADAAKIVREIRKMKIGSIEEEKIEQNEKDMARILASHDIKNSDKIAKDVFDLWKNGIENRYQNIMNTLKEEGVPVAVRQVVRDVIKMNTGLINMEIAPTNRVINSIIRTVEFVSFLGNAVTSQILEPATHLVKSKSVRIGALAFVNRFVHLGNFIQKQFTGKSLQSIDDLEFLSEVMGVISDGVNSSILESRGGITGKLMGGLRSFNQRFFDVTLQHPLTQTDRIISVGLGQVLISRLVKDIVNKSSLQQTSKEQLMEWGVPPERLEGFTKFVTENGSSAKNKGYALGTDIYSNIYRNVLRRYVDGTVMAPVTAQRVYASAHPFVQAIIGFTSYTQAIGQEIGMYTFRQALKAVTPNEKYTIADRAKLASGLLIWAPAFMLLQGLQATLREQARGYDDPEDVTLERVATAALQDSGMFGKYHYLIDIYKSFKYGAKVSDKIIGPFLGDILKKGSIFWKLFNENSPKTNTAEWNATKATVDIANILLNALATVIPYKPVGTLIALTASNPLVKRKITNAKEGKKGSPQKQAKGSYY